MRVHRFSFFLWLLPVLLGSLWVQFTVRAPVAKADDCETIVCSASTQSDDEYLSCNKKKQQCWEQKIQETQSKSVTLTNTINLLNGQISLQQLQVDQTMAEIKKLEGEVEDLTQRIRGLGYSLDRLGTVLIERVQAQYKQSRTSPSWQLLGSDSFTDMLMQARYLSQAQKQTADIMARTESQRLEYDGQKVLKEEKQDQLEVKQSALEKLKTTLQLQKKDQQYLLSETKNNEAKYQSELAKTMAELQAIQSIIAGRGSETKIREVTQGETIASIISGPSACSTGTHLHFEVVKDGTDRNPVEFLKSVAIINSSRDDSFNFSGSWEWPLDNPARVTQGWGMTYYARVMRAYGGSPHTGIDMVSKTPDALSVKAVRDGTLYRGSIRCGGGLLRYVKIDHASDAEDTYYLHINY